MFYRISSRAVPFHVFSELEDVAGLIHAFTSRETDAGAGKGDDAQWATSKPHLLEGLGLAPEAAFQLRQMHSARVLTLSEARQQPEGDGLLVTEPGCFAVVKTADCLPVLVVDPESRSLCLIHAGWRGTAAGAVRNGVDRLLGHSQANPARLVAALGP
ncbi:MAG: polyphenol oxidase family protein, partial [Acidobacteriota bacterium]